MLEFTPNEYAVIRWIFREAPNVIRLGRKRKRYLVRTPLDVLAYHRELAQHRYKRVREHSQSAIAILSDIIERMPGFARCSITIFMLQLRRRTQACEHT